MKNNLGIRSLPYFLISLFADILAARKKLKNTNRQAGRQTYRQTDRQTDRQAGRQTIHEQTEGQVSNKANQSDILSCYLSKIVFTLKRKKSVYNAHKPSPFVV